MIVVLEPFINQSHTRFLMSQLQMYHSHCSVNNNILLLWNVDVTCKVVEVHDKPMTCKINHLDCPHIYFLFLMCMLNAKIKETFTG